jgi:translation initiation factor IF-1
LHQVRSYVSFRARSEPFRTAFRPCFQNRDGTSGRATRPGTGFTFHESFYMSKGDLLEMEGVIQDALGGGQYNIRVDQGGAIVRAQLSGRMRRHHIRVLPGDRVRVAVSPYDLSHGLIVYRGK